jgi:DNA-binding response OmpR family regulator
MQATAKRILVVEDESAFANIVRHTLERAGLNVTISTDGRDAWELLQVESFQLLISDHRLPGMLGTELCQRIRQDARFVDLPIIMLTCASFELDLKLLSDELRVVCVLPKPFSPKKLVAAAKMALKSNRSGERRKSDLSVKQDRRQGDRRSGTTKVVSDIS